MSTLGRRPCEVPGCRRTRKAEPGVLAWICADHWRAIPRERRRVYALARRRGNAQAEGWLWPRLVRIAIERASGL